MLIQQLEKSLELSKILHEGQYDKCNKQYFKHPLKVSLIVEDVLKENKIKLDKNKLYIIKSVALLHDVIEDCNIDANYLRDSGINEEIIEAVLCLTKVKGEGNNDYLEKVMSNNISLVVKIADLMHNLSLYRMAGMTLNQKDFTRIQKYLDSTFKLQNKLKEVQF